jgi:hypothetical protein
VQPAEQTGVDNDDACVAFLSAAIVHADVHWQIVSEDQLRRYFLPV